jgi:ketosteroid isomerase-like protein
MRLMSYAVLISALALAASPAALAQQAHKSVPSLNVGGVTEEILSLEREYDQAYAHHDADAFERMHTDDFRMTARGKVATRAEVLAQLRDANRPRDVIESLTSDDVQVRAYGDTVVTTGRWKRVSKSAEGMDTSAEGHFTRVWVRQGGRWRMSVAHYSPIAGTAKRP